MKEDVIPQADPAAGCRARSEAIAGAMARVLESGRFILGDEVRTFEEEWAEYLDAADCIGVASGTDAVEIALRAGGIGSGDLVFAPSHTAVATIAAIERTGAAPCLVDIDAATFTLDPDSLASAIDWVNSGADIGPVRPGAVVPVHLYGHPADMPQINEIARNNHLLVVEDGAQAHGAAIAGRRVGSWGEMGAFSFYPTKNLGALGDGGAVVTGDPALGERIRQLREYGWKRRYVSQIAGINSRLDEIQAAVLRVNLAALDDDNDRRRQIASRYTAALDHPDLSLPALPGPGSVHVYHQFVVQVPFRDDIRQCLKKAGVETGVHYPLPVHRQPAYRNRILLPPAGLPVTDRLCPKIMSLPMYPQLSDRQVDRICAALAACLEASGTP